MASYFNIKVRHLSAAATTLLLFSWTISIDAWVNIDPYSLKFDPEGWTGLNFLYGKRFNHAEPWVSLEHLNARRCVRMCWLYRACTALTYTPGSQRCDLHRLDSSRSDLFSTVTDVKKVVVDVRQVAMASSKQQILRGCDKRPCSENEMCAPVRNTAFYVCLQLDSETCPTSTPSTVPNTDSIRDGVESIVYACAQGHVQSGNGISTCDRRTKTWSVVDITCRLVDCGPPPPVMGAVPSSSRTTADATVSYSCLAGAVPTSPGMTSTCQDTSGQWSPIPGPCSEVSCGPPPAVDLMTFELTARSDGEAFPGLTNESLAVAYGGEAVYTCNEGYKAPERSTYISQCQADGTWSSTASFRCSPVDCYKAPEGSTYISQCQADGTWSSTASFLCSPVDCGPPLQMANSRPISPTDTTYGQNVTVECLNGFSPVEGFTLTCGVDGQWGGPEMTCHVIKCSEPSPVQDATVVFNSTDVSAVAKYDCVEPAYKEGEDNSTAVCNDKGEWSAVGLRCLTIPCGAPPSVDNTSYFFIHNGSFVVEYVCDEGFIPAGDMTRVCSNTWSTNDVTCTSVPCGPAPHVNNTMVETTGLLFQDTATYTCDPGYALNVSSPIMTCAANGRWTPEFITCAPMKCDSPELPSFSGIVAGQQPPDLISSKESGLSTEDNVSRVSNNIVTFAHGEQVTIKCASGYLMYTTLAPHEELQSETLTCVKGNWTASSTHDILCVPNTCAKIPSLPDATSELRGDSSVEARYQCNPGYGLGSDALTPTHRGVAGPEALTQFFVYCDEDLGWNVSKEVQAGCEFVGCGAISLSPESGLQAPEKYNSSLFSTVELSCRPPYYQNASLEWAQKVVVCLGDGGWSMDAIALTCAPCNQGEDAAQIPNSILEISAHPDSDGIGDTANLTCAPNFVMPGGPRTLQCASVGGSPTWVNTENATCLQTRWVNPEPDRNGDYIAPVHLELVTAGLDACVNLTFSGERVVFTLEEIGYLSRNDVFPSRVMYLHNFKKYSNILRFYYTLPPDPQIILAKVLYEVELLTEGENAVLCMKMNLTENVYQFLKNGEIWMDMDVKRYDNMKYFNVGHEGHVFDINISYF